MKNVDLSKVYRLFYPNVPVIVAASYDNIVSAMPVVSLVSLSNKPSRVGFSSFTTHSTYKTILSAHSFSISWLDKRFVNAVELLGLPRVTSVNDKLAFAGFEHHKGRTLDVPVIDSASAVLECSLLNTYNFGDHDLIIGDVKAAYASEDFSEYWQFKDYHPILYIGSAYGFRVFE
jgi:flavin reductase (DIM6/NTAB) family NADH-FMN oxidoreductase RutF